MKKTLLAVAALSLATQVSAAAFDGFYAGVNGGLLSTQQKVDVIRNSAQAANLKVKKSALTVGIQTGYATTFSNCLFAAGELSLNYNGMSSKKKDVKVALGGVDYTGSIKGRKLFDLALAAKGGYNFGAGVAYAGGFMGFASYKSSLDIANGANKLNTSERKTAFVYGPLVGAEFKITDTLTAGLEGRMELARKSKKSVGSLAGAGIELKKKPSSFAVLARLNYAF